MRPCRGTTQLLEHGMSRVDRFEGGRIAVEPLRLLCQTEGDRSVPFDVGPTIHVVADPTGEAEWQRARLVPPVGEGLLRARKHGFDDAVARILRIGHGGHCPIVFVAERDLGALVRIAHAGRFAVANRRRDGIGLLGRKQEGRMRSKHRMHVRLLPERAECVEIVRRPRHPCEPFGRVLRRQQIAQPIRTRIERLRLQFVDQSRQRVDAQLAALELARNVQRELKHRIEQRSFLRLAVEHAQAFAQTREGRFDCRISHHIPYAPNGRGFRGNPACKSSCTRTAAAMNTVANAP